jgi:hypothetical protein
MIPYDDLVAALRSWRSRNGLPASLIELGGRAAGGPAKAPPARRAAPATDSGEEESDLNEDSGLIMAEDEDDARAPAGKRPGGGGQAYGADYGEAERTVSGDDDVSFEDAGEDATGAGGGWGDRGASHDGEVDPDAILDEEALGDATAVGRDRGRTRGGDDSPPPPPMAHTYDLDGDDDPDSGR